MQHYRNVMEEIVEEIYNQQMDELNCCSCKQCHNDIVAYALNHLPPHYVASSKGELFIKYVFVNKQMIADIAAALAQGAAVVRKNPRHNKPEK